MDGSKLSHLSEAEAYKKIGEFWDTHDFTDFDDANAPDAEFEVSGSVAVESSLLEEITQRADQQGLRVEELVNLWLRQKLAEQEVA